MRFAPLERPPSMTSPTFTARVIPSISAVDAKAWDACANPPGRSADEAEGERFNPFIAHAFLNALEASGSVGGRSRLDAGACDGGGRTRAHRRRRAVPISRATARANMCSTTPGPTPTSAPAAATIRSSRSPSPFTPVTGRRLLVARRRAARRARGADRGRCANCADRPKRRRFT